MNKGKVLIIIGSVLTFVGIMDIFNICSGIPCDEIEPSLFWDIFFDTLIWTDFWFTYPGIIILIIGFVSLAKHNKKVTG